VQDELSEVITRSDETRALAILEREPALIHACDRRGWTPLHMAAAVLNQRLMAWLLDHGADVNRRGPEDSTPLDLADGTGWRKAGGLEKYPAVAGLLRARGAELTARSAVALGEADWLRSRHAEGTLVNRIYGPGGLLSVAVRHDRPEMLRLLLDLGFDPDERTRLAGLEEVVYSWGIAQSARGWGLSHYELLSWLRVVRQPLRPVSARAGRKEFIETTTRPRIPGGRSPSRGHGGALLHHSHHTGMVRSRLLEPVNQEVSGCFVGSNLLLGVIDQRGESATRQWRRSLLDV
jgi:hypothetical protein